MTPEPVPDTTAEERWSKYQNRFASFVFVISLALLFGLKLVDLQVTPLPCANTPWRGLLSPAGTTTLLTVAGAFLTALFLNYFRARARLYDVLGELINEGAANRPDTGAIVDQTPSAKVLRPASRLLIKHCLGDAKSKAPTFREYVVEVLLSW